jgi:hypothetical protein
MWIEFSESGLAELRVAESEVEIVRQEFEIVRAFTLGGPTGWENGGAGSPALCTRRSSKRT